MSNFQIAPKHWDHQECFLMKGGDTYSRDGWATSVVSEKGTWNHLFICPVARRDCVLGLILVLTNEHMLQNFQLLKFTFFIIPLSFSYLIGCFLIAHISIQMSILVNLSRTKVLIHLTK